MNTMKNKVQLIGHLGADPEVKEINGTKMAKINLATNDTHKKENGEKVEETQWHNVIVWGRQAEIAGLYLRKGSEVMVDGKITYREYTGKDGIKRQATEVVVQNLQLMGKKP